MRKLFCTMNETMSGLMSGAFTDADLAQGIFYFFDTHKSIAERPHWAAQFEQTGRFFLDPTPEKWVAHKKLMAALMIAEKEGRVAWVEPGKSYKFEDVNRLLAAIGLPEIAGLDGREQHGLCSPAGIYHRLMERNIPLEVITNDFHWPLYKKV